MNKFYYKVLDKNNKIREGEIEGEDLSKVATSLLQQGLTILDLKQKGLGIDYKKLKSINIGGVALKDKVTFIRQMSFMINAGLSLTQALEISSGQIQNQHFRDVVTEVLKDVQGGTSLSKSMEKHPKIFDSVVRNLIKAGEESGKLDMIMERVADDLEKKQEFNSKVKSALIYPVIILCAIVGVIVLLLIFMIPQMAQLFEENNAALPAPTQIIINTSEFLRGLGGIFTGVIILALIISSYYYKRTPSGKIVYDKVLTKLPIFGVLIVKSQVASFARTFSMLISAGVPILDALRLVADSTTNAVFKDAIEDARKKVEKGIPLSQPLLATNVFPPIVGHMARVGEETGKIDEVIAKVGLQYSKEVDQMAANLTKLMEPIILLVMGFVIGVLAIAIYLPIFNLGSVVSGLD